MTIWQSQTEESISQGVSDISIVNEKGEHYANAKYENPLKISEKIACVSQRLMYPIIEEKK